MSTLTGSIEELMTPQLIDRLAAQSGVPGAKVRTGMTGAVTSILDGLATRAHDPRAMGQVADLVRSTPALGTEQLLDDEASMARHSNQLLGVVGGDSQTMASRISRYAGIGAGAASGFVAAASAVVIGAFRKLGRMRGGLDASSLSSTLIDEERDIHAAVPAGMLDAHTHGVTSTLRERAGLRHRETDLRRSAGISERRIETADRGRWWVVPLLLIGAVIAAIALWGGSRKHTIATPVVRTPKVTQNMNRPETPRTDTPPKTMGAALGFPANSAEAKLVDQLKAPTTNPAWIDLDLRFDTGQAALQPGASAQLGNIAKALEAYPSANVRIAGYSDGNGGRDANQALSQARADAVRQELIARGVDGSRIEAKGYPHKSPTDEGAPVQAQRRAAIQVVSP